ncbi:uncharacterized protein TNCV_3684301 [Trichonephila clavipes]|uniref:Uncharacterized protein n=1 Tax=Trichonephila clavipes TaxID=2585209 RepID=A0A8X6RI14_TRICX|nr:uncharacterized protein TNCV_3684301 [Trichonephila clavipes]
MLVMYSLRDYCDMYLMYGRDVLEMHYELLGSMPVDILPAALPMSTSYVGWTTVCEVREAFDQQPSFTILEDSGMT